MTRDEDRKLFREALRGVQPLRARARPVPEPSPSHPPVPVQSLLDEREALRESAEVLAFCQAPANQGGSGALLALLAGPRPRSAK